MTTIDYCYGSCRNDKLPIPHRHPEQIPVTTPPPRKLMYLLRSNSKARRDEGIKILKRFITIESVLRMHYDWDHITYQDFDKRYPWIAKLAELPGPDQDIMMWAFAAVALGEEIDE